MKELVIDALTDNVDTVLGFIEEQIRPFCCSVKTLTQINIAAEELFVNIAHYAYQPDIGKATVRVTVTDVPLSVEITFIDNGKRYDPFARPDPDIALSAEQRQIGGLGIYIVKKSMDDVKYEYKNGKNVSTIRKKLI